MAPVCTSNRRPNIPVALDSCKQGRVCCHDRYKYVDIPRERNAIVKIEGWGERYQISASVGTCERSAPAPVTPQT